MISYFQFSVFWEKKMRFARVCCTFSIFDMLKRTRSIVMGTSRTFVSVKGIFNSVLAVVYDQAVSMCNCNTFWLWKLLDGLSGNTFRCESISALSVPASE